MAPRLPDPLGPGLAQSAASNAPSAAWLARVKEKNLITFLKFTPGNENTLNPNLSDSVPDFIATNDGEHIRGSECDQKILSKKESSGFVFSPNYPFPYMPKIVCRYFIYGMQDSQNLERVRLDFMMFEITNKNE